MCIGPDRMYIYIYIYLHGAHGVDRMYIWDQSDRVPVTSDWVTCPSEYIISSIRSDMYPIYIADRVPMASVYIY